MLRASNPTGNAHGLKPLGLAWKRTSLPYLERSASRPNMPLWVVWMCLVGRGFPHTSGELELIGTPPHPYKWLLRDEGASQKGAPFFRGASRSISKGEGTE